MDLFKDPVALEELYDYLDKIDLKQNSLLVNCFVLSQSYPNNRTVLLKQQGL